MKVEHNIARYIYLPEYTRHHIQDSNYIDDDGNDDNIIIITTLFQVSRTYYQQQRHLPSGYLYSYLCESLIDFTLIVLVNKMIQKKNFTAHPSVSCNNTFVYFIYKKTIVYI